MRTSSRAAGIVIKENKILLIHRKNEREYYVFPGGGIEEGETKEQATVRELREETSTTVEIDRLLYHLSLNFTDRVNEQYYFLCNYVSGETKLGEGNEMESMKSGTEFYEPVWIPIQNLNETLLYPLEIRDILISDFKNGFSNSVNAFSINASEQRK